MTHFPCINRCSVTTKANSVIFAVLVDDYPERSISVDDYCSAVSIDDVNFYAAGDKVVICNYCSAYFTVVNYYVCVV